MDGKWREVEACWRSSLLEFRDGAKLLLEDMEGRQNCEGENALFWLVLLLEYSSGWDLIHFSNGAAQNRK